MGDLEVSFPAESKCRKAMAVKKTAVLLTA